MRSFLFLFLFSVYVLPSLSQRIDPLVCPQPKECYIDPTDYHLMSKVTIVCPDTSVLSWTRDHLTAWYGKFTPEVEVSESDLKMNEEAYDLSIKEGKISIQSAGLKGIRYALYTLRQLAIAKRGTETVDGWIVPNTAISDCPKMSFRGVHICWFPETQAWEVERLIRLAAYYKMNYAVLESWGTFKSPKAPWFGWPEGKMTVDEIKRLCSIAQDLGIILIPQLNLFGHATSSRVASGKHAILDFNPEYQPLFEPAAGWNWCLTNPNTRKLLVSIIDELMDAFGNPPFFHMGCDEADPPSCPDCTSRPYSEIFLDHINAMRQAIVRHGAKPMMWHDMFLEKGDRWRGFVHNGTEQTAKALETLPKDIVICDWYYGNPVKEYPSLSYFKEKGFHVLSCPWDNIPGIIEQGRQSDSLQIDGMLCTLWHHYFGANFAKIYPTAANATWNGNRSSYTSDRSMFYTHLRQIGWDMNVQEIKQTGIYELQIIDEPYVN